MALNFCNNNSLSAITAIPASISGGGLNLISTQTASSSSSLSFTSGLDSTYKEYVFRYYDMHPATDNTELQFQVSTNGGSSYGVAITSTAFQAYHYEVDGSSSGIAYYTADDLAQSTSDQQITGGTGSDNDQNANGNLYIFNPLKISLSKSNLSTDKRFFSLL